MINNRSLPTSTSLTTPLDHFGTSSPAAPPINVNSAMAAASAIAASITAQSLQKSSAVASPKPTEKVDSPESTFSPKNTLNPSPKPAVPAAIQPIVRVSLDIQLFTADKLYPTPSMADKLPFETEFDLRLVGCELIQTAGRLLKLSQTAMATGQVLFHRFFYIKSFVKNPMEYYAMASIFLSSKIEECPRRIRDVMNVFHHMKQVRSGKVIKPMPVDELYYETKNQVIKAERRMLKELGFCIHVKHPHKIIFIYLQAMECTQLDLSQKAWNFMNDSLRTDIFLRYTPENIVCACIYLAARELKISLPQSPPWFTIFGADEESIKEICVRILHLYAHKTKSQEELEKMVFEINEKINEEKRRTREEKYKATAANVAAAITSSTQELSKKSENIKEDTSKEENKSVVIDQAKIKAKFEDRKFPHQQRGHVSTPPDQVLSHHNPYYLNHHPSQGHVIPGHPVTRHQSFGHQQYPYYPDHPHYMNGQYPGDHYQNENYYDVNMRRNKSSNELVSSSHYKEIEELRHHKSNRHRRSRDRSRSKTESKEESSRSKISNQTNKIDFNRSKSRSRSPWQKRHEKSDRKSHKVSHKYTSRSKSRSLDSIDSEHSGRSPSSTKHKKKSKTSHHSSSSSHRKEERSSREKDRRDRERSSHSRHHHKSSKSKGRSRDREHSGESNQYVPIYS